MSKNKQNGNTTSQTAPATTTETTSEGTTEKPKLSKEQLKALFVEYDKLDTEHQKALAAAEAIKAKKSTAVKAIFDAAGKGPFGFNGDELTVTKRDDTFFFRGKRTRETLSID